MAEWRRFLLAMGPVGVVSAWIVLLASWYLNRDWFVFTKDAYSDFGGEMSCCPDLYNYGLIIVGIIVLLFGVGLVLSGKTKLEVLGGGYFALAGVFLALIGVFPSGTRPHTFVSTWFFVQADLGLLFSSLGLYRSRGTRNSLIGFLMSLAAFPIALLLEALVGWPSAAVLETYGIIIIDIVVILLFLDYWKSDG